MPVRRFLSGREAVEGAFGGFDDVARSSSLFYGMSVMFCQMGRSAGRQSGRRGVLIPRLQAAVEDEGEGGDSPQAYLSSDLLTIPTIVRSNSPRTTGKPWYDVLCTISSATINTYHHVHARKQRPPFPTRLHHHSYTPTPEDNFTYQSRTAASRLPASC